ncbi:MAG: hypothetical protein QHJ73_02790, partial [Armatimonadota bacterium]|nr:hypothetical protein [Armatimonadota bacterium]
RYGLWGWQRAEYEGGQRVYVNLSTENWNVEGHVLPPGGTWTAGPRAVAGTALRGGHLSDYARFGDVVYADARSHQWLPPEPPPPITPVLGEWRDHGDGSVSLTVNWRVGRVPERDFTIFWHLKEGKSIAQQSDHAPAVPTSRWRVGETVNDGPRRVALRADRDSTAYELVVGLYDRAGRARLIHGRDEVRIATLHLARTGGKLSGITVQPVTEPPPPGVERQPYLEGANQARVVVDFGDVATNGAVVVRGSGARRVVIPVPIGEAMRVGLGGKVRRVVAHPADGAPGGSLPLQRAHGKTWFAVPAGVARLAVE